MVHFMLQRTLFEWVRKVDERGFAALRAKKQPGKKPKLNDEQTAKIKNALLKPVAEHYVWNGITLSEAKFPGQ